MQVQIKFINSGANSLFGAFVSGDKLRCTAAMARHLVESGHAEFIEAPLEVAPAVQDSVVKPIKAKKVK